MYIHFNEQRRKADTAISKALESACIALIKQLKSSSKMWLLIATPLE